MALKKVSELRDGDVLEQDVLAPNGRFLFKKGTVLTNKHIVVLKSWGVLKLNVSSPLTNLTPNMSRKDSFKRLEKYFPKGILSSPVMKEIYSSASKAIKKYSKCVALPVDILEKSEQDKKIVLPTKLKISPEKLVESQRKLCSLPNIYDKMMKVLNDPNSSAANIGEVVSKDSSLTAKLLSIVNSPHLGLISKIETVSRAIAILGLEHLKLLAKGIILIESFKNIPSKVMDMKVFWRHSISVALMSSILSTQKVGLDGEKFFVAGLLHDIGKLLMLVAMPGLYLNIILYAKNEEMTLYEAEKKILGFTHGDVGALLSTKWHFPNSLIEIIKTHHKPLNSDMPEEASILCIGDVLAQATFYGFSGNIYFSRISKEMIDVAGVDITSFDVILSSFFKQIKMLEKMFL